MSMLNETPLEHRRLLVAIASFVALSAFAGGAELVLFPHGNAWVPIALLAGTSFTTFLIPGLLLGLVVGTSSALCAVLAWRRHRGAIDATVLAGGALIVWLAAEMAQMRTVHFLHVLYGGLGLALVALGLRAAWRAKRPRYRWLIATTFASPPETLTRWRGCRCAGRPNPAPAPRARPGV
jgi:hypothetical protein